MGCIINLFQTVFPDAQTFFTGLGVGVALIATILAYRVGRKQNEINIRALGLQDFAEVFLMPQQVVWQVANSDEQKFAWNLLIKNTSSYPIYIHKYIFNDKENEVGGSVVPNRSDDWYVVPIPEETKEFSISIEFEDHQGRKYMTEGDGKFNGKGWSINSKRRVDLN
ncbi:MAG: hypothetical protein ACYC1Y_01065 [Minisyncoccota bacterium]